MLSSSVLIMALFNIHKSRLRPQRIVLKRENIMSKRKILSALKKKNITPSRVEYMRGCPTPSGYANGWDLDFPEHLEDVIYSLDSGVEFSSSMEFDGLESVMDWIDALPAVPA